MTIARVIAEECHLSDSGQAFRAWLDGVYDGHVVAHVAVAGRVGQDGARRMAARPAARVAAVTAAELDEERVWEDVEAALRGAA